MISIAIHKNKNENHRKYDESNKNLYNQADDKTNGKPIDLFIMVDKLFDFMVVLFLFNVISCKSAGAQSIISMKQTKFGMIRWQMITEINCTNSTEYAYYCCVSMNWEINAVAWSRIHFGC